MVGLSSDRPTMTKRAANKTISISCNLNLLVETWVESGFDVFG